MPACCLDLARNRRDQRSPDERVEIRDGKRIVTKWVRSICGECGRFLGYRPASLPTGRDLDQGQKGPAKRATKGRKRWMNSND